MDVVLPIVRGPRSDSNFTVLDNTVFNAPLRPDTLGVWVYLLSKPDNWQVVPAQLQKHFGIGRDALRRVFRELQDYGVMVRAPKQDDDGKLKGWEYVIYEDRPKDGFSGERLTEALENRPTVQPSDGKSALLQRTEYLQRTECESAPARICPADFEPDPAILRFARYEQGVSVEHELFKFKNHEFNAQKTDWNRAFLKWLASAKPEKPNDGRSKLERESDQLIRGF